MSLRIHSRSLEDLGRFYRSCGERQAPMYQLVLALAASRYTTVVHAATSHITLLLAATPTFDWDTGVLRITYDGVHVVFIYAESPFVEQRRTSRVSPEEAFATLERFIQELGWIIEYRDPVV
jgi:hypothetical protein